MNAILCIQCDLLYSIQFLYLIQFNKYSSFYSIHKHIIHKLSETHRISIGDTFETGMSNLRPIGKQHVWSETNIPHRRPACLIGDQHASLETSMPHWRTICLIGDPSAMLDQACWCPMGLQSGIPSSTRLVGLEWVFN